jgi:hypothetical protein
MLLEARVIDSTQLQAALGHQRRWGGRFGQALVDLKMVTEEQVIAALAEKLGYPRMSLENHEFGPALELALRLVPHEFAERNQLLPYAADASTLWVAMADPTNMAVVDELAFRTGRRVKVALAGDRQVARAVRRLYLGDKKGVEAIDLDESEGSSADAMDPLDPGFTQGLDQYFAKEAAPARAAPPVLRPTPPAPAPPAPAPAPAQSTLPPPLPPRAAPAARSGPEARLDEAVRGLRRWDEPAEHASATNLAPAPAPAPRPSPTPAPIPALTPGPVPVIEVVSEPEPSFGPRLEAMLDGLDRISLHEQCPPEIVRLSRIASALVRLLVRKGLVSEDELVSEFVHAESVGPRRTS